MDPIAVVLDTSAILRMYGEIIRNELTDKLGVDKLHYYTTNGVLNEIKSHKLRVSFMVVREKITILEPTRESLSIVLKKAKSYGCMAKLSDQDMEIVALAVDMTRRYHRVIVATGDMAIQNICILMGIDVLSVSKKMTYLLMKQKVCLDCGTIYSIFDEECPKCFSVKCKVIERKIRIKGG